MKNGVSYKYLEIRVLPVKCKYVSCRRKQKNIDENQSQTCNHILLFNTIYLRVIKKIINSTYY